MLISSEMSQHVGRLDPKMAATFITIIDRDAFSILQTLINPKKLSSLKLAEINDVFTAQFQPNPIIIAERYKFNKREQEPGESITDYIAKLRKLMLYCEFKDFLDIRNHNIQLLVEES